MSVVGDPAATGPDPASQNPPAAPLPGAHGRTRTLAQFRFLVAAGLVVAAFLVWYRAGFAIPPGSISESPVPLVLCMVAAVACASVGLLLTLRRPEVRIGALEAWLGLLAGGLTLAWAYLALVDRAGAPPSADAPYVGLLSAVIATPSVAALAIAIGLRFPTDRLLGREWRRVVRLAAAGALLAAVGRLLRPGPVIFVGRFDNPVGVAALGPLPFLAQALGFAALGTAALLTGASLVMRYRVAEPAERAQLRVFTVLALAQGVCFALFIAPFVIPSLSDTYRDLTVEANLLVFAIGPLAVALAIARYRLYEIDHLVGRTFVYGALTAILAGLYAASLKLFQVLFSAATGESSDAALVLTTLVLVATFTPVKTRLDLLAARWTGQPAPGAAAAPTAAPAPEPEPPARYDPRADPEFAAFVDERIREMLAERYKSSR